MMRFPWNDSTPNTPIIQFLSSIEWSTYSVGVSSSDPVVKKEWRDRWIAFIASRLTFNEKKLQNDFADISILINPSLETVDISLNPLILTGHYAKLLRTIAQTRHFCYECKGSGRKSNMICPVCKGEKVLTKESVQELITPFFKTHFECGEVLFHGAGREDVDVRMLGSGRPFALTLEHPHRRTANMSLLEREINSALRGKVQLSHLQLGHPRDVAKVMQTYHTKRYRALVESSEKISLEKPHSFLNQKIDVVQTTPVRVEKRRVMKERPHWIILEKIKIIDDHHAEIELHSSAGCYIKEFISGDEGRTTPSFAQWANVSCICKELDVVEIVNEEASEKN